jgi:hypothetical protein
MQKNVVIQLHIGNATGRNILAGVLKRIKDRDVYTIWFGAHLRNSPQSLPILGNNLFKTTSVYCGQPPANLRTPRSFAAKRKVVFISCSCCFQSQNAMDSAEALAG